MGKAAARCPCGLFFSIAELSCFKCSWLTLRISTPSHFPSCQMSPSPWVLLTLSFVQAAFWSHHVTIVDILKPSSCLASIDTCLLLSSSSLVDIHLGFCDTVVSCFSSSRPHSSLVTAFFCLPPTICPTCALSPTFWRWSWRKRAHILSNSVLPVGPHIPWIYISNWAASRAASLPVIPFLGLHSGRPSTLSPRPETWDLSQISFLSPLCLI